MINSYDDFLNSVDMTTLPYQIKIQGVSGIDFFYGPYSHKDGDPYYIAVRTYDDDEQEVVYYYNNDNPEGTETQPSSTEAGVDGNYNDDREYAIALARLVLSEADCLKDGRLFSIIGDEGKVEVITISGSDTSMGSVMMAPIDGFDSDGVLVYADGSVSVSDEYLKIADASTSLTQFTNDPLDARDASTIYATQRWVADFVKPISENVDDVSGKISGVIVETSELKLDMSTLESLVEDISLGYTQIESSFGFYATNASVDTSLSQYVTNSSFNETVGTINASIGVIDSCLPSFALKNDLSVYALDASLLDYAKKTDLSLYVTDSSFNETVGLIDASLSYIESSYVPVSEYNYYFEEAIKDNSTFEEAVWQKVDEMDLSAGFLSKTDAASTYLTISDASSTYMTETDASSMFAGKDELSLYVTDASFNETLSTIDTSISALESSVGNMVTRNDLSAYVTDSSLSDELSNYLLSETFNEIVPAIESSVIEISETIPTLAKSADLSAYATTQAMNMALAEYVTDSSFDAVMASVDSSISDLSTAIPLLATKEELADYATVESLSDYVIDASLTDTLSNYVTTEDASELFTGMFMCDMSIGYSENDIQATDDSGNIVYGPNPAIFVSCDKSISDIVDAHDSGRMVYCKVYDTRTNPNPANKIEPSYDVPLMMAKVVETYNESAGITVVTKIALFKLFYDNNEIQFYGSYSYQNGNEENNTGDIWSLNYSQSVYESPANKSDVITETPKPYQYPSISAVTNYTAGSVDVEFKPMTRRHAFYVNANIMYRDGVNVECDGSVSNIVDRFNSGSSVSGHITDYSKILVEGYYNSTNNKFYENYEYTQEILGDEEHLYKDISTSTYYSFSKEHYDYLMQYGMSIFIDNVPVDSPEPNVSAYYNSEDMLFYTDSSFNTRCADEENRYYMDIPSEGLYAFVSSCFVPCEIEGILINRGGIQLSNTNVIERDNMKRVDMIYFGNNVQISFLGMNTNSSDTDIWSMNINEKCFENVANKVTEISKASDDLYPSVSAVMNYVSSNVPSELSSRLLTVDASISALDTSVANMVTMDDLSVYAKDASLTDKADASTSAVSLETIVQVLNKVIDALNSYTGDNISSITFNSDGVYFSDDVSTTVLNSSTSTYISSQSQTQSSGGLS